MKPLCRVDPSLFLVFTGPSGSPEPRRELERFRAACTKPAGEQPMWTPEPVLTIFHGTPEEVREHMRKVVEPALAGGSPVLLEGGWWPEHRADSIADAILAGAVAWGARCPTLTVVFPHDGCAPLTRLAAWAGPAAVALQPGNEAELTLQIFDALGRRGVYTANGWLPSHRSRTTPRGKDA